MEFPELSLAPTQASSKSSFSPFDPESASRKRKLFQDHLMMKSGTQPDVQANVDLQLKDPLPLDWEQCLDLESGRMYYLNRKTLRKSWNWPIEQSTLDLELNISPSLSDCTNNPIHYSAHSSDQAKNNSSSAGNGMVALACLNCHLLVILSKSSPACPNCKYVHSLPSQQSTSNPLPKKSFNTLSLLN
ncbi:hypothetical protein UlMin_010658 [Ulmus minor]